MLENIGFGSEVEDKKRLRYPPPPPYLIKLNNALSFSVDFSAIKESSSDSCWFKLEFSCSVWAVNLHIFQSKN